MLPATETKASTRKQKVFIWVVIAVAATCFCPNAVKAGNLVCGAASVYKNLDMQEEQIKDIEHRKSQIAELLTKDPDNKKLQSEYKALETSQNLIKGLNNALRTQAQSSFGRTFIFDAPDNCVYTSKDQKAQEFGLTIESDLEKDFLLTLNKLMDIDTSIDNLLSEDCYKNISQKEKKEIKQSILKGVNELPDEFFSRFGNLQFKFIGIRKGLRGKDWLVFRALTEKGDFSYYMMTYETNQDGEMQYGPLFLPATGDYFSKLVLAPCENALNELAGHKSEFDIPRNELTKLEKETRNNDFEVIIKFFEENPEFLWKKSYYDIIYMNAVTQQYAQTIDADVGEKLLHISEKFRNMYPGNIMPDANQMAVYLLTGNYDNFIICIDHIRAAVIDDPFFIFETGLYHLFHSDIDAAMLLFEEAYEKGFCDKGYYETLLPMLKEKNASEDTIMKIKKLIENNDIDDSPKFIQNG